MKKHSTVQSAGALGVHGRRTTPHHAAAARDWLRTSRRGFCEETELDSGASCARGRKGAWDLKAASMADAAAKCLALCGGCPRCHYVSVTVSECSWFKDCDMEALGRQASFRSGPFPGRLNSSQGDGDEGDAPWLAAAASSRSADWEAAPKVFSPLIASAKRVGRGPIGIGAHFGTLKEGYWSYLQITLRAWRERANASLVILTDQAPLLRSRLGQVQARSWDESELERRRKPGWGTMAEVIVQPVNVTHMKTSWGIAKELHGTDSQWYRHLLLSSFLRLSCQRSRGVLLLDLKDVLVQHPPWPLLVPGHVTVFEEIGQLRHSPWNRRILAQFSTSVRTEVATLLQGEKKVINSGVILAPPAPLLRHVDALVDEMWALGGRHDRWMIGVDQAAHMLLVYRNRTQPGGAQGRQKLFVPTHQGKRKRGREPRFEIASLLPHAIGPVLHVSDVDARDYMIDEQGVVRPTAADGAAYVVVHQWNRAPGPIQRGIRRAWASTTDSA